MIGAVLEKPKIRRAEDDEDELAFSLFDDQPSEKEWPPSPWISKVFSLTGQWEERAMVREGELAGIVEDMRLDPFQPTSLGPRRRYGACWHGALYVHCRGGFVTRYLCHSSLEHIVIYFSTYPKYGDCYMFFFEIYISIYSQMDTLNLTQGS